MSVSSTKKGPYTQDEVDYLSQFSWGLQAIEDNKRAFGDKVADVKTSGEGNKDSEGQPAKLSIKDPDTDETVELSQANFDKVKNMETDEVKGTLQSLGLSPDGSDGAIRARLAVHLESKA